jgi:ribosome biogenesis GTPase A
MVTVTEDNPKSKSIIEVLEFCKVQALPARVVGKWVWVKFESKPNADIRQALKDFGFRWSKRRGQWAHNCGHHSRPARNYRPWDKYQTTMLEDYVNAGLGVAT